MAVRVHGESHKLIPNDVGLYAHSSPVYCYRDNRRIAVRESAAFLIQQIDQLIHRVETRGVFREAADKEAMIEWFRKGQQVYRKIEAEAAW